MNKSCLPVIFPAPFHSSLCVETLSNNPSKTRFSSLPFFLFFFCDPGQLRRVWRWRSTATDWEGFWCLLDSGWLAAWPPFWWVGCVPPPPWGYTYTQGMGGLYSTSSGHAAPRRRKRSLLATFLFRPCDSLRRRTLKDNRPQPLLDSQLSSTFNWIKRVFRGPLNFFFYFWKNHLKRR